jgi:hypothetical protein
LSIKAVVNLTLAFFRSTVAIGMETSMHATILLLATFLVAGDPVADFEIQGVRLGMKYSEVARRLPELKLDETNSDFENLHYCCVTKPGDLANLHNLSLEFVDNTLLCITICYSEKQFGKPGIGVFCSAIRDRFGATDQEYVDGSCAWIARDGKSIAMLVECDKPPLVGLRVGVANEIVWGFERQKRAIKLGF